MFWKVTEQKSSFCLGSTIFAFGEAVFLPYGVHIKGVIEKGLAFDEKNILFGAFL